MPDPTQKTLSFIEALERIRGGGKMRRIGWRDDTNPEASWIFVVDLSRNSPYNTLSTTPKVYDMLAEDWETR